MVAHVRRNHRDHAGDDDRNDGGVIGRLKLQAADVSDRVRSGARALKEQATEKAGEIGRAVTDEANRLISGQKGKAVAKIQFVGATVDKAARLLHAAKVENVAGYVDLAARSTRRAAKYVDKKDLSEMLEDANDLAKMHPAAVLGGMFLVGLAAGRFLKASQLPEDDED
jgi:hypothetical protein